MGPAMGQWLSQFPMSQVPHRFEELLILFRQLLRLYLAPKLENIWEMMGTICTI